MQMRVNNDKRTEIKIDSPSADKWVRVEMRRVFVLPFAAALGVRETMQIFLSRRTNIHFGVQGGIQI
jgi:hypothetical protein